MMTKLKSITTLMLAICFVISTSGCNKKEDQAQKAAEDMAKSMQQTAQNMAGTKAAKAPGVAVPSKTLAGFLPTIPGYKAKGQPETMEMDLDGAKYSHANQDYENGDKKVSVAILDYNNITTLASTYTALASMTLETDAQSFHPEQVSGNPGWLHWDKRTNSGEIGVIVNDRVYVIIKGENGATIDDVKSVASNINYSGIASAAK